MLGDTSPSIGSKNIETMSAFERVKHVSSKAFEEMFSVDEFSKVGSTQTIGTFGEGKAGQDVVVKMFQLPSIDVVSQTANLGTEILIRGTLGFTDLALRVPIAGFNAALAASAQVLIEMGVSFKSAQDVVGNVNDILISTAPLFMGGAAARRTVIISNRRQMTQAIKKMEAARKQAVKEAVQKLPQEGELTAVQAEAIIERVAEMTDKFTQEMAKVEETPISIESVLTQSVLTPEAGTSVTGAFKTLIKESGLPERVIKDGGQMTNIIVDALLRDKLKGEALSNFVKESGGLEGFGTLFRLTASESGKFLNSISQVSRSMSKIIRDLESKKGKTPIEIAVDKQAAKQFRDFLKASGMKLQELDWLQAILRGLGTANSRRKSGLIATTANAVRNIEVTVVRLGFYDPLIDVFNAGLTRALKAPGLGRIPILKSLAIPSDIPAKPLNTLALSLRHILGPQRRAFAALGQGKGKKAFEFSREARQITSELLEGLPEHRAAMYSKIASDVVNRTKEQPGRIIPLKDFSKLEAEAKQLRADGNIVKAKEIENKIAEFRKGERNIDTALAFVNIVNRAGEYISRDIIFAAEMDNVARTKLGTTIKKMREEGDFGYKSFELSDINNAITVALDKTFGKEPASVAGKWLADIINKTPISISEPFGRFVALSLEFNVRHSPFGLLRALKPEMRERIRAGDTTAISEAMVGSSLYFAAYMLRKSKYAGEKWYQMDLNGQGTCEEGIGDCMDLRVYLPLVAPLAIVDLWIRLEEGTLGDEGLRDLLTRFTGSFTRTGSEIFSFDRAIAQAVDKEFTDALKSAGKVPVELIAQFFQSATGLRDWMESIAAGAELMGMEVDRKPDIILDTDVGVLSPILDKLPDIPGAPRLDTIIPPARDITSGLPRFRRDPELKQTFGISKSAGPINALRAEMNRLNIKDSSVFTSTGNDEADNLIQKHLGEAAERSIVPFIQSFAYQSIVGPKNKRLRILEAYAGIRGFAMERAIAENPELITPELVERAAGKGVIQALDELEEETGLVSPLGPLLGR